MQKTDPREILKKYWGFEQFRHPQDKVIEAVLNGQDTLALMPTGGGKSICFQVPALMFEGLTLVVSPLIALMRDQVIQAKKRGIAAEAIYSGMSSNEIWRILDNASLGKIKLLYLSPERLKNTDFKERLRHLNISMIAVDEAHCISQWGYDFRPSYLDIPEVRSVHPKAPILALTATATPKTIEDIQNKLGFKNSQVIKVSFYRDNLSYIVEHTESKQKVLIELLTRMKGSAIIYTRSRKKCASISKFIQSHHITSNYYHAGLDHNLRMQRQDEWIKGQSRVMVATNAFGMGVDKPDVRLVIHTDLPDHIEGYFQEAGRGGRDGKPAFAILLYHHPDKTKILENAQAMHPDISFVRKVYKALGNYLQIGVGGGASESFDFNIEAFTSQYGLRPRETYYALKLLEENRIIAMTESVFRSSEVQILIDQDDLYNYRLKNKPYDLLLNALSRMYQGIFQYTVPISEPGISKVILGPVSDIEEKLSNLHKSGIITYVKQRESPQILFLEEKIRPEHLELDYKVENFRKERDLNYARQMNNYIDYNECRSRFLLNYFGEGFETTQNCGSCDWCRKRVKQSEEFKRVKQIAQAIRTLLTTVSLSPEELAVKLQRFNPADVQIAVQYLEKEGWIVKIQNKLIWTDKSQIS